MLLSMQTLAPLLRATLIASVGLTTSQMATAQLPNFSNSIIINGAQVRIDGQPSARGVTPGTVVNTEKSTASLFPVAPQNMETHSTKEEAPALSDGAKGPTIPARNANSSRPKSAAQAAVPEQNTPDFVIPPLLLRATNVQPSAIPKIRWLLFQSSERSANTGQLTCLGWARSINLAKALETEGPFHAAVASASVREDLAIGAFWNNAAEATIIPLASKWDAPVWALSPADAPMDALSALYQFSKNAKGSANIAVSWDAEYLERFQVAWLEGLVKSGDMDGLQAFSWKQKIRKWSVNDKSRIDVLEYTVENGKLKNVQWRTMNLRMSGPNHGCPTS